VTVLALAAGEVMRLDAPRGLEVRCESGHLWITEEAQADDVWLGPGQRVRLVGDGLALLEAKGPARLRIAGNRFRDTAP
jgi:hypothetical protein